MRVNKCINIYVLKSFQVTYLLICLIFSCVCRFFAFLLLLPAFWWITVNILITYSHAFAGRITQCLLRYDTTSLAWAESWRRDSLIYCIKPCQRTGLAIAQRPAWPLSPLKCRPTVVQLTQTDGKHEEHVHFLSRRHAAFSDTAASATKLRVDRPKRTAKIIPAKAREYVFTGVGLCVCVCLCVWPR